MKKLIVDFIIFMAIFLVITKILVVMGITNGIVPFIIAMVGVCILLIRNNDFLSKFER